MDKKNLFINIISVIYLGVLIYLFIWDLNFLKSFKIIIFTIISFSISMYISDNFKLSNIKFIKNLQKFVFFNCILAFIGLIFYLLDVSIF